MAAPDGLLVYTRIGNLFNNPYSCNILFLHVCLAIIERYIVCNIQNNLSAAADALRRIADDCDHLKCCTAVLKQNDLR